MPGELVEKELSEQEKNDCLNELRKLLSENEKLRVLQECDDIYLVRFLYSTNFVTRKAFKKIKMFYDTLEDQPHWFTVDPPSTKREIIEKDIRALTNVHDYQGRPVYIVRIGNLNARTMDLVKDVIPVDDFFMELLLATDPNFKNGICVIVDVYNLSWSLLKWLSPSNVRIALRRMQSMPLKEYKIHVVNSSRILTLALNLIWPFLPQQIKDGVEFHFENWEALHQHINKELLPPEFGGTNTMDFVKLRESLYDRDTEIADSFKMNRQPFLRHIEKFSCK